MRAYKAKYKDPNGKQKQVETWSIHFRDPNGKVQRWGLGTTDKDVAEVTASQINSLNEWAKKGLEPKPDIVKWVQSQDKKLRVKIYDAGLLQAEQANITRTLAEHLADYIAKLRAFSDTRYPERVEYNIKKIMAGCGFEYWSDVDGVKIRKFLKDKGYSNHYAQHFISSFKTFSRWLKKHNRIKAMPVIDSIRFDVPTQRAFEENELQALFKAAEQSQKTIKGMTGRERHILYRLAYDSGLRRKELGSLTRSSFGFENLTVFLSGKYTKNGKDAFQTIRRDTINLIKDLTKNLMPDTKVFSLPENTAIMIREDAKTAGIELDNWQGKVKFKSLRSSLATHLANRGVPMHLVKKIMRHANIETTAKYYLKIQGGDVSHAINSLDDAKRTKKQETA